MAENQTEENLDKPGSIGKRLKELIDYYHLNMNTLSIRLHLPSNSIITRIVKDPERGMSLELIQKVLFEFREISPDWFVMGRGEMLINKEKQKPEVSPDLQVLCDEKDKRIVTLERLVNSLEDNLNDLRGGVAIKKHTGSG